LIIPNSYNRLQNVSSHRNIIVLTTPNIFFFFFFSFFFPACCSPFVPGKRQNPNKNYPLLYKPVSQRSFQKVGWKPNQKASDFVSQNLPFFHPRSSLPFSLLASQREREICDPVLAAEFHKDLQPPSSWTFPLPGRRSLRRRPLQCFFSLVWGTLSARFATTVRSSSDCKEPDLKNEDRFSKVEPELELFCSSK
jgi:hypothetical protein